MHATLSGYGGDTENLYTKAHAKHEQARSKTGTYPGRPTYILKILVYKKTTQGKAERPPRLTRKLTNTYESVLLLEMMFSYTTT